MQCQLKGVTRKKLNDGEKLHPGLHRLDLSKWTRDRESCSDPPRPRWSLSVRKKEDWEEKPVEVTYLWKLRKLLMGTENGAERTGEGGGGGGGEHGQGGSKPSSLCGGWMG